jgi:hypothetical protein
MPAFSHFFLKRLSARSKFSSSWIMTSDKFYFPPSRQHASPAWVQTAKLSRPRRMGQANRPSFRVGRHGAVSGIGAGASEGAGTSGTTVARAEPLTTLVRSAHSRVSLVAPLSRLRAHPPRTPGQRSNEVIDGTFDATKGLPHLSSTQTLRLTARALLRISCTRRYSIVPRKIRSAT